jgi:glucosamine-6-phosphate deaminase
MRVVVRSSADAVARTAADMLAEAITRQPSIVLGLPTGRTPIGLYHTLVARHREGKLDLRQIVTFNVDEFVDLPRQHPGTYAAYMARHLFRHVNVAPDRQHLPAGDTSDPRVEAQRYEAAIQAAGGIDVMLLGIGENGHIGFNEPGETLVSDTHVARLRPATRRANAELFGGDLRLVPREGITMGAGTLLRARHVVLLATGTSKARIVARALQGPVTTRVPASLLQTHPNATAILDRAAAGQLRSARETDL